MSTAPSDRMDSSCRCGARFKVAVSSVGKKAKCPKCGEVFTIQRVGSVASRPTSTPSNTPAPSQPPPALKKVLASAPVEPSDADQADSLLDDWARMERQAASVQPSSPAAVCQQCGQPLVQGAKVCMKCGYNALTGRVMRAATVQQVKVAEAIHAGKRFALGVGCCGGVALVSAVVWFLIALATFREFAWIAWLLGLACGFAMLKGRGEASPANGMIAAGFSIGGILLAKALIFAFVVYAALTGETTNVHVQRIVVADLLTQRQLDEEGIFDDGKREKRYDEIYPQVELRVGLMSEGKLAEFMKELRDEYASQTALSGASGGKRYRLAWHAANRRATQRYLPDFDERRSAFFREELQALQDTPEDELDAAITALQAWEKVGRWEDEAHIRNECVQRLVNKGMAERKQELRDGAIRNEELERDAWKAIVARGETECDGQSHEQRVADLRTVERQQERENEIARLADHRAERRAVREGLQEYDERRDEYYDEEASKLAEIEDAALKKEIAHLDAWDQSERWKDEDYVRDLVAYHHAVVETNQLMAPRWKDDDEENDSLTDEEWRAAHADGLRRADALPANERLDLARKIDRGEVPVDPADTDGESIAQTLAVLIGAFFAAMLRPVDLVFFAFAVVSAYRIAATGLTGNG